MFSALSQIAVGAGHFQIQLVSYQNIAGELRDGRCCDGSPTIYGQRKRCENPCETFFKICLKQYGQSISANGRCTFGKVTTKVLGKNSFAITNSSANIFSIRFMFSWLVSELSLFLNRCVYDAAKLKLTIIFSRFY